MADEIRVTKKMLVRNKQGLHARPAALFVQIANKFDCNVTVKKGKEEVNGKSIMGIMMLAAARGSEIMVIAEGEDAHKAIEELENLVSNDEEN